MQNQGAARVELTGDREIVITRAFAAPRALVFEMWTNAEHVTHWWDPSGMPLGSCEIDLREGGAFRFVHDRAGEAGHAFTGVYREIEPPSSLVFTTPSPSGGRSTGTLQFTERDDTTVLTMTISCESRADRDALLAMRVDAGTARTLDNLGERLATMQSAR